MREGERSSESEGDRARVCLCALWGVNGSLEKCIYHIRYSYILFRQIIRAVNKNCISPYGRRRRSWRETIKFRTHITTFKLTKPMNWTKSDQADSVVLHIIVAPSVPLPGQLGSTSQAADHNQRQYRKAKDARNDGYDNRFGWNCK